ncbi:MAG: bifunctional demethylmenaquinone methyltransferase/2-methoxy-6-polyprenyl-1,4-benzoquinol methylase [Nitrospirae bacterium RBG_13_39_12]|nr:MAG: bifunctional demethylmenaquinone methyltransferase/2-methoxy-6-polyprenyl-1,4-benzoquinol methylase [Nitrospirae bacterium RBG_13_39_12]
MNIVDYKERDEKKVEQMFSAIAPRYDLLNHVLSLGLDFRWRKKVAMETGKIYCRRILDVCTGTGDMAIELCRFWKGQARIEGLDFSNELLEIGRKKVKKAELADKIIFREGNAEKLPYEDEQFDAITITFGLRNIKNRLKALKEFYRVTKPDGCFVCLEFSRPETPIFSRLYSFYLAKLIPLISNLLGSDPDAYRYLGMTIGDFPSALELVSLIKTAGWKNVTHYTLAGGIVAIHRGTRN